MDARLRIWPRICFHSTWGYLQLFSRGCAYGLDCQSYQGRRFNTNPNRVTLPHLLASHTFDYLPVFPFLSLPFPLPLLKSAAIGGLDGAVSGPELSVGCWRIFVSFRVHIHWHELVSTNTLVPDLMSPKQLKWHGANYTGMNSFVSVVLYSYE